jgi:peroxiredoxin Q/BCP
MQTERATLRLGALLGLAFALAFPGARAHAADLEVGQPAPDFSLADQNATLHRLADFKGKTLILAFYPKDFTGG